MPAAPTWDGSGAQPPNSPLEPSRCGLHAANAVMSEWYSGMAISVAAISRYDAIALRMERRRTAPGASA